MSINLEDVHLINLCKQNNAKAQMALYDKYCDAMFNIATRYVNDSFVAEDLVQEAFLNAFTKLDHFKMDCSFGAWLKRIVINKSLDWIKQKKMNFETVDEAHLKIEEDIEYDWEGEHDNMAQVIYACIDKLPENFKVVMKLYLFEGYDHQEISSILNISSVASRTFLHRGKQKLIEQLKQ